MQRDEFLISPLGIDYTNLRDLLAAGNWPAANKETWQLMVKAANREKASYLFPEYLDKLPG